MKVAAFIPIKMNNERTPGKNTKRIFDGKSILEIMQETLVEVSLIDEVYVFCSNEKIKDYVISGVNYLKRPSYLDEKEATPNDIINEFIKLVDADIYAVCHATSPFVSKEHINECIDSVVNCGYDSSFTAEKIQKLLWSQDNRPLNFDPENVPRTQDLNPIYNEVSACYAFTKEMYCKLHRRVGVNPHITVVSGIECVDIDYPEDLEIAETIYTHIIKRGAQNE